MWGAVTGAKFTLLTVMVMINTADAKKDGRRTSKPIEEICTAKCEPEKCPNVGPIGLSHCPTPYIKTYNCGCCKKCDMVPVTTTISPSRRDEVCREVSCPKKKVCVLNIQGLPVCKCPTEELCKKYASIGGGAKKMKVCGSDGVTYPSRCHLKVASCNSAEKKIRVSGRRDCNSKKSKQRSMLATPAPSGKLGILDGGIPTIGNPQLYEDEQQTQTTKRQKKDEKRRNRKEKKRGKSDRNGRKKDKAYQRVLKRLHSSS